MVAKYKEFQEKKLMNVEKYVYNSVEKKSLYCII